MTTSRDPYHLDPTTHLPNRFIVKSPSGKRQEPRVLRVDPVVNPMHVSLHETKPILARSPQILLPIRDVIDEQFLLAIIGMQGNSVIATLGIPDEPATRYPEKKFLMAILDEATGAFRYTPLEGNQVPWQPIARVTSTGVRSEQVLSPLQALLWIPTKDTSGNWTSRYFFTQIAATPKSAPFQLMGSFITAAGEYDVTTTVVQVDDPNNMTTRLAGTPAAPTTP